jgi:hypothetical protein
MCRIFNKLIQHINLEEVNLKIFLAGYKNKEGIVTMYISAVKYKKKGYKGY